MLEQPHRYLTDRTAAWAVLTMRNLNRIFDRPGVRAAVVTIGHGLGTTTRISAESYAFRMR